MHETNTLFSPIYRPEVGKLQPVRTWPTCESLPSPSLCFSNFNMPRNHLGIFLKCTFSVSRSRPGPKMPHFYQAPRCGHCSVQGPHFGEQVPRWRDGDASPLNVWASGCSPPLRNKDPVPRLPSMLPNSAFPGTYTCQRGEQKRAHSVTLFCQSSSSIPWHTHTYSCTHSAFLRALGAFVWCSG